jgi:hypothetical protein
MTKSSLGDAVARDTEAAKRGALNNTPLVDVYGGANRSPVASRFGVGARTLSEIVDATNKQARQGPGDYSKR